MSIDKKAITHAVKEIGKCRAELDAIAVTEGGLRERKGELQRTIKALVNAMAEVEMVKEKPCQSCGEMMAAATHEFLLRVHNNRGSDHVRSRSTSAMLRAFQWTRFCCYSCQHSTPRGSEHGHYCKLTTHIAEVMTGQ